MPALTRAAARQLAPADADVTAAAANALVLRANVTAKADTVWKYRADRDVYTHTPRADVAKPQVDHVLECQLGEVALARAYCAVGAKPGSFATAQAADAIRTAWNDSANLNVTDASINLKKKGPFQAALRRATDDRLRSVPIEQLARQGKAKNLVDDGTWARIETAVVRSYDDLHTTLIDDSPPQLPATQRLVLATEDELSCLLASMGLGA